MADAANRWAPSLAPVSFLKASEAAGAASCPRPFTTRGAGGRNTAAAFFLLNVFLSCVRRSEKKRKKKVKSQNAARRKADERPNRRDDFFYDVFLQFLHTEFPLRMMNCSQGINQNKGVRSPGTHRGTDSASSGGETRGTDSCTDLSNYLLSFT